MNGNDETPDTPEALPAPRIEHRRHVAPIWLLPLLALVVGGWLVWRSLIDTGPRVTIEFETAEGIVVNQTQVRYRGIPVGVVKRVEVKDDLSGVRAEVEMDKKVQAVPADSLFWLVQPQISVSGVSGLSTLFSGNYIAVQPGDRKGPSGEQFKALKQAPALPMTTPGLHLKLHAERTGSIGPGTPIYYRQIAIGSVQTSAMNAKGDGITLDVHILPDYAKLVRKNTRFWNASGISLSANLSGLRLQTESLASILSGGIAMSSNGREAGPSVNGDDFTLFPDFEAAEAGFSITLRFPSAEGLSQGVTKVMYKGMAIGKVLKLDYDEGNETVTAKVGLDPRVEIYATDKTRFWLVKPQLSVAGVSGLDALLSGTYISFAPDPSGQPSREFVAASGPSPLDYRAPGLHLLLTAPKLGSLAPGSPVYHRQVQVGQVVSHTLDAERDKVDVHVLVEPEYVHLVNESTRFWNASGVTVNAGLSGVKLRTESVAALLAGGIAFDTANTEAEAVGNGFRFTLFEDEAMGRASSRVRLSFASAEGLVEGQTRVIYRGLPIGQVERVRVSKDFRTVEAIVGFNKEVEHLLTEATQFWLVKPELSVSRVTGLDALFSGVYLAIQPGAGKPSRSFVARTSPPPLPTSEPGLHLVLESPDAGSVSVGAPVLHKKLTVGSVQDVRLGPDGKHVQVHLHIAPEYAGRVGSTTRFWGAGGLDFRAGSGGVRLRTESLAAIIAGGVAFDNFDSPLARKPAHNGDRYKLYESSDLAQNAGFPVSLQLASGAGLKPGAAVVYRGLEIGELSRVQFKPALDGVVAEALLRPPARALMRHGTRIWRVKAELGLARTANLGTLLTGDYLELRPGPGAERFSFPVEEREPALSRRDQGLNLVLSAPGLGSLKVGDPVLFRQIRVGEVIGSELAESADQVQIYINIEPAHAHLVRAGTKFWQASGIAVDAGLFSGVSVRTESLETILAGGIAFATPEAAGAPAGEGGGFVLHAEPEPGWLKWQAKLGAGAASNSQTSP